MAVIKKYWIYTLLIALCVEIAFFVSWAWQSDALHTILFDTKTKVFTQQVDEVNQSLQKQIANLPQGLAEELASTRLYFMFAVEDTAQPQSFVFEDGTFSAPQSESDDDRDLYYSYSPDGSKAVFFATTPERKLLSGGWGVQAQLFSAEAPFTEGPFPSLSTATVRDSSNITSKQHPVISNAGEILFVGWEGEGRPNVEEAEDWSVYKVVDGKAQFLLNGFMPKWISDTEFLVLKNDGVYVVSSDLAMQKRIGTSTETLIYSNNRIDISPSGDRLSWFQPNLHQLQIYAIDEDYALSKLGTIYENGFWSVFSPSGKYLAVETISKQANGTEESTETKIEFYDLSTFEKIPELEIDLDAFDQMYMFMTEWAKK